MGTVPPPYNPQNDPRWQREQARAWRDQQKAYRQAWKQQARAQRYQWRWQQRGLHRSSIVGPLLLVTIGILFFLVQSGHVAASAFWGWYGRWWPLLMVGLGVLLLLEWSVDRAFQKDASVPTRSVVGGGVVGLVVVLAIVGIIASGVRDAHRLLGKGMTINGDDWEDLVGSKHESDSVPVVRPFVAGHALVIDNPRGDVTLAGTSDDGQLHLTAHNEVRVSSDSDADGRLRQLEAKVSDGGDTTTITVPSVDRGRTDLTVLVPANVRPTVMANRGEVHVNNIKGSVNITANHGNTEITAITGPVIAHVNNRSSSLNVHSVTGNVTVEGSGDVATFSNISGVLTVNADFFGGSHFQKIAQPLNYKSSRTAFSLQRLDGELNIGSQEFSADGISGPVSVETRRRNVTLNRVSGDVKVKTDNGTVEIGTVLPVGSITVDNHNGEVTVSVPDKAKFTFQADASGGNVNTDLGLSNQSKPNDGSMSGTYNGGGSAIRLSTTHGDITLNRGSAVPLPPTPPAPRLSGVPMPPSPLPPDVKESIKEARESAKEAAQEAREAAKEAEQQAREATKEAREKAREAERLAREAAKPQQ